MNLARTLQRFYRDLLRAYGPQGWWPARSPTEIVVGAILTQNTSWRNVEKAIAALRAARLLNWRALHRVHVRRLADLIRPAGYFNVKARRIKAFADWLIAQHGGSLTRLAREAARSQPATRAALLAVHGVGPETADSILLYALNRPAFVVDAYTRRLLLRHGLINGPETYDEVKQLFERNLPRQGDLFNEYHALIVQTAKRHCKSRADCTGCPLAWHPHDEERPGRAARPRRSAPP